MKQTEYRMSWFIEKHGIWN